MAGGALGGVIGAAFRLIPTYSEDWIHLNLTEPVSQSVSAICFLGLCAYVWRRSLAKPETDGTLP
jgi:hypothetical protein